MMFKQLSKLLFVAIGATAIFSACADDPESAGAAPETFDNFSTFAAGDDYDSPIIPGMKLNLLSHLTAAEGDLVLSYDNETPIATNVGPFPADIAAANKALINSRAIYQMGASQYFGLTVTGGSNTRALEFTFARGTDDESLFLLLQQKFNLTMVLMQMML